MQKRRKLIHPPKHLRSRKKVKKVTQKGVGRVHVEMRSKGYVTSSPVSAPRQHERVWVRKTDPWASLMDLAEREEVVARADLPRLIGTPKRNGLPIQELSRLGIVAVPTGPDACRLLGTFPELARIVNRAHHGKRRRRLTAEQLVRLLEDRPCNGRSRKPSDARLESWLLWVWRRFDLDLSNLVDQEPVLV